MNRCGHLYTKKHTVNTVYIEYKSVRLTGMTSLFQRYRRYIVQWETPSERALNTRVGKICDFRQKSPFFSETV